MTFIYDPDMAVVPHLINSREGIEVQLEPDEEGYGTDEYNGDALDFQDPEVALEWAEALYDKVRKARPWGYVNCADARPRSAALARGRWSGRASSPPGICAGSAGSTVRPVRRCRRATPAWPCLTTRKC